MLALLEYSQNVLTHLMRTEHSFFCLLNRSAESSLADHPRLFHSKYLSDLSGAGEKVYALLFRPLFPTLHETTAMDLDIGFILYREHFNLLHHTIHQDGDQRQVINLEATFLLQESLGLLSRYFPQTSYFWYEFERHQQAFMQMIAQARDLSVGGMDKEPYNQDTFESVVRGRAAIAKCVVAALAVSADVPEQLEGLYLFIDELTLAKQLYDDVKNWQNDHKHQRTSFLLQRFATEMASIDKMLTLDEKTFKQLFLASETLRTATQDLQERLEKLLRTPDIAPCTLLLEDLRKLHKVIALYKDGVYSLWQQSRQNSLTVPHTSCKY